MNIKEVAKRAGVSTATVSRTMNGSVRVSKETAQKVQSAIDELNFVPDTNARSLGSGRSSLLGLIISDITNPFFPELVKAFEDEAIRHGREILIANTGYDPEKTVNCVTRMLQRKVDGVAIMTSEMDEHLIGYFQRKHIPVVFFDNGTPSIGISCVHVDYSLGIELAVNHLVELGHRRIAFISGPQRLASARVRQRAFTAVSIRARLEMQQGLIQEGNHRPDGGLDAMGRLLALQPRPTAVITSNDLTAIGAMGAIAEAGLRIPEDMSIVGFDNIQLSAYTVPSLSTVKIPFTEIACAAVQSLLVARGDDPKHLSHGQLHVVKPELIMRKSTAAPQPE